MNYKERVGQNINYYRKVNGKTLKEVAEIIGITEATMQKYEAGKISRVDIEMIEKIARAIETTPSKLTGWLSKEEKEEAHKERIEKRIAKGFSLYRELSFNNQKKINELMDDIIRSNKEVDSIIPCSSREKQLLNDFAKLDNFGKDAVDNIIEAELRRVSLQNKKEKDNAV